MRTRLVEVTNDKGATTRYIFEEGLRFSLDENVLTVTDPDDASLSEAITDAYRVVFYPIGRDGGAEHLVVVSEKSRKAKQKRRDEANPG